MKIIAFVGLPLSGKSTASEVAREMGIPVISMGDVVREEVRKRGLKLTDENVGRVANELREKEGLDAVAKMCIPKIRSVSEDVVVVDGIRGIAEVERFKKAFGNDFVLINIESPSELRLERAKRRKREDDLSIETLEDLRKRDERELSWGMDEAIKAAHLTVENVSNIEDFKDKIRRILRSFTNCIEVEIETVVHPTEDPEKVVNAIKNLFPDVDVDFEERDNYAILKAKTYKLDKFRELIRMQRILDTVRAELKKGWKGNESTIILNKQAATVSRVNFADEDTVLSPLIVTFRVYGVPFERFVDWLAPETKDGKPLKEIELWGRE